MLGSGRNVRRIIDRDLSSRVYTIRVGLDAFGEIEAHDRSACGTYWQGMEEEIERTTDPRYARCRELHTRIGEIERHPVVQRDVFLARVVSDAIGLR